MVQEQLIRRGITDERVLKAMGTVPRHLFVPPRLRHLAYDDSPLPIGAGQTISQPFMVALMTQLLRPAPDDRVLEIGVGSGYQTAVLAELVREVIGLERIPELAEQARKKLEEMGYRNVTIHVADGSAGFPEAAPYDGILVAAAAPRIPEALLEQLAEGGRLVIPVGDAYDQMLERAWRQGGSIHIERLVPVRFVPLIGRFGFQENG
ncbi:MAG TPA: protein-L-isoaspartate(D-aspartate) O-methyltransferase [Chloroflexi bacterium]|nr:protein-L-isoaspartate(D-aspartate) O-methyltransferase [Chloroflexota bacterium]